MVASEPASGQRIRKKYSRHRCLSVRDGGLERLPPATTPQHLALQPLPPRLELGGSLRKSPLRVLDHRQRPVRISPPPLQQPRPGQGDAQILREVFLHPFEQSIR